MAISSNNVQVYTTLSKELVAEIDKDAKGNFRTRSQQIHICLRQRHYGISAGGRAFNKGLSPAAETNLLPAA